MAIEIVQDLKKLNTDEELVIKIDLKMLNLISEYNIEKKNKQIEKEKRERRLLEKEREDVKWKLMVQNNRLGGMMDLMTKLANICDRRTYDIVEKLTDKIFKEQQEKTNFLRIEYKKYFH